MRISLNVLCFVVMSLLFTTHLQAEGEQGVVVAIIDGESIVVRQNGRDSIVRLVGITVPESHRGPAAAALDMELALRPVQIEHDIPALMMDGHGSRLAYVYRLPEGTLMNYHLVRHGLATVPAEGEFLLRRELIAAQSAARLEKRGLWSGVSPALVWETQFKNVRYLGEVNYQTSGGRPNEPLAAAKENKPAPAAKVRITNRK